MSRLAIASLSFCLLLLALVGVLGACQTNNVPAAVATSVPTVTPLPTATPAPTATASAGVTVNHCLNCHANPARLQSALAEAAPAGSASQAGALAALYASWPRASERQRWEQLYVDHRRFPQTVHGQIACTACHGGANVADATAAHVDLAARPSADYVQACGECHNNITATYASSLHNTAAGFSTALATRAHSADQATLAALLAETCDGCAATCGDCHVATAPAGGGGLLEGHLFRAVPDVVPQCTACHGQMASGEYLGGHNLPADVHYAQGGMTCTDCHNSHEMHGEPDNCQSCHAGPQPAQTMPADHPYSNSQSPSCESCHVPAASGSDGSIWHTQHGGDLSCQTCHALPYDNCTSCHIEADGTLAVETTSQLMIGRNPLRSYVRPYQYVTLRHVPVQPDSFAAFGSDLLTYFDRLETWRYATPHTIQRNTPQTATCFGCHGNDEIFLTADKLAPYELNANRDVVVPLIPQAVEP